jgi:hypothetical protein
VCKALAERVLPPSRRRFIDPSALLLGSRCSLLVAPLGRHGSLQDLLNTHLAQGQVRHGPAAVLHLMGLIVLHC